MTDLALEPGLARGIFDTALFTWVAAEAGLRLRSIGGRTADLAVCSRVCK